MAESPNLNRRDFVKAAGVAAAAVTRLEGAPAIQTVKAANNVVQYGVIGTGGRGQYLIRHMNTLDGCRCVAVCDIYQPNLEAAIKASRDKPKGYLDYRELLARTDVDAVIIAVPLYLHFPITRDALLAGKHVFCEKSLVFKPEEVHAMRALVKEHPKQVLQVGLQRRYSKFYQTAKQMIDKGMLGKVTHIYAQWHRNPGWRMRPAPDPKRQREWNWRLFREFSGGLTAELGSHQIDVASWMFGAEPEFVVGVGSLDTMKDGRDVYDNIQLIFNYPGGRKLMYSSISTNKHLPLFQGTRTEFGEVIMGTEGTIEITVGTDEEPAIGLWYYEPGPPKVEKAAGVKEKPVIAGATLASTGKGQIGLPLLFERDTITGKESFLARELKYARLWLYKRGIMVPEEDRNPVDVEMDEFFECCRTGARPKADVNVGLADSTAVILANLAMDEGRRVYFHEIEKMGRAPEQPKAKRA
ncbi:MAG: Gfo/Idh/MocA family protein [Bryobacteraceae bacterium]